MTFSRICFVAVLIIALIAGVSAAENPGDSATTAVAPVLTDAQKLEVRERQLAVVSVEGNIAKHQLAIAELNREKARTTTLLQDLATRLCPGFVLSNELKCVKMDQQPVESSKK